MNWFTQSDQRPMYLWRSENEHFIGIVCLEIGSNFVLVRRLSFTPTERTGRNIFGLLTAVHNMYPDKKLLVHLQPNRSLLIGGKHLMDNQPLSRGLDQPTIKVSDFEGPLDLLLHLIRNSEMDIYDIQITAITSQYLSYLHQMQDHQLEVAGEYLVMAATLMSIKSKMLLPHDPIDDEIVEDEDPGDPRQELVDQLLEYKRYKLAATELKQKEQARQLEFTREALAIPAGVESTELAPGLTLDQLQRAFSRVVKRKQMAEPINQTVKSETISISVRIDEVFTRVLHGAVLFEDLFDSAIGLDDLVTTFLAVLELAKHQAVLVQQDDLFSSLTLAVGPRSEEFAHDQFGTN